MVRHECKVCFAPANYRVSVRRGSSEGLFHPVLFTYPNTVDHGAISSAKGLMRSPPHLQRVLVPYGSENAENLRDPEKV